MMEKTLIKRGFTYHEYAVRGCVGMTEREIVNFCDYANFGGCAYVNANGDGWARVYID